MDLPMVAETSGQALEWCFNLCGNPKWVVVVTPWKIYGLIGAFLFAARWVVQMYYSRKAGKPVTPRVFWVMSMAGSLILLTYFIFSPRHQDMVGIVSNLFPALIAAYNLYLDLAHAKRTAAATSAPPARAPGVAPSAAQAEAARQKTPDPANAAPGTASSQ